MVKVILRKGRDESVRRFHPWVFSGSIAQIQGTPAEGDLVLVYAADGTFLACGHYQIGSIAVRILSFDSDILAPDFWETMIPGRSLCASLHLLQSHLPDLLLNAVYQIRRHRL